MALSTMRGRDLAFNSSTAIPAVVGKRPRFVGSIERPVIRGVGACSCSSKNCTFFLPDRFAVAGKWRNRVVAGRRGPVRGVPQASVPVAGPATVEMAGALFTFATAFVVPMYTLMMIAPKWEWTRKAVESSLPFVVLGALYIYLFALSCTPETLPLMFSSKYWLPELPGITRMFSNTITVASAWVHLLAVDLFAARQVFLDGLREDVETRHSLVLCLMMCPIGIFCHIITKSVTLFRRRANSQATNQPLTL